MAAMAESDVQVHYEYRPVQDALRVEDYPRAILERTRQRIEIFDGARHVWRFAESLKSISEDTAQEYEGRATLELIQNGHDAFPSGVHGRIKVRLDLPEPNDGQADGPVDQADHGVLYVANDGRPFTATNFEAITELALSDKAAGQGIGNKGLGFRSVLQLTDWPEIYSKSEAGSTRFDGYCFRFATPADVRRLVEDEELADRVIAEVSPLALPLPADVKDQVISEFSAEGYATVVRLPLRNAAAATAARSQIDALTAEEAPLLLFLERVSALHVEVHDAGDTHQETLTRGTAATSLVAAEHAGWVVEVELGAAGRYLMARRTVDRDALMGVIERSIGDRQIDERWRNWDGEAWVGIALRLDAELTAARLYTFLPMAGDAKPPLMAHVHAPFFTKLARLEISETVALNDFLLDEVAALAVELLRCLRETGRRDPAPLLVDLACWDPPDRIAARFPDAGSAISVEPFIPLVGTNRWGTLTEAFLWPAANQPATVFTADAVAQLGVDLVDPSIGAARAARLDRFHSAIQHIGMHPETALVAEWAEELAGRLVKRGTTPAAWADFYDDLAQALAQDRSALQGRQVVLDQDGGLRRTLGGEQKGEPRRDTIFFAPEESESGDAPSRVPSNLRALRRRIAFTHPDIPWNLSGMPPRKRPGRHLFEADNLVREYRTDRLLDALRELLGSSESNALRRDILLFTYRQFAALNDAQRKELWRVGLWVPGAEGGWKRAGRTVFSPGWGTPGATRLQRLLELGGDTIAALARQRAYWIIDPSNWPFPVDDQSRWAEFLRSAGVRDGAMLLAVGGNLGERNGIELVPTRLAQELGLTGPLGEVWSADTEKVWHGGNHRYTRYRFDRGLTHLPGSDEVGTLPAPVRRQFAELMLLGLRMWPDTCLSVTLRRPRQASQQDRHVLATPIASFLRHFPWVPLEEDDEPDGVRFVRPHEAWVSVEGELPAFVPRLPLAARRLLDDDGRTLDRLRSLGLRVWGNSQYVGAMLHDLGELLDAGAIPEHQTHEFKKQCQHAWGELAAHPDQWPWSTDAAVRLPVIEGTKLVALEPSLDAVVYIPDEASPVKQTLAELAGHSVLVADPPTGEAVATLLMTRGVEVTRLSEVMVEVLADGQPVVPNPAMPRLVADGGDWLTTVVGLVVETKSGPFIRYSQRGIQRILDRLRDVRIVRPGGVELVIDGAVVAPPASTRSLPLADAEAPTVVVWGADGIWDELQAAAPALAQLLDQPSLQDALELTFVKLERLLRAGDADARGDHSGVLLEDDVLARALDTTPSRIAELRRGLLGDLADLAYRLRPVLLYAAGLDNRSEVEAALEDVTGEEMLLAAVERWAEHLPKPPSEILVAVRSLRGLSELRDELGLDYRHFNRALLALAPDYIPIRHPERHAAVMEEVVNEHASMILDRLRERFAAMPAGEDLSGYLEARTFAGLEPDPAWLDDYEEPPVELVLDRIADWLIQHGADPDLHRRTTLDPVEAVRTRNVNRLDELVRAAERVVRAWCRRYGPEVPPGWLGAAGLQARTELEQAAVADLIVLDDESLLAVITRAVGWPAGMPVDLDPGSLGLTPDDMTAHDGDVDGERQRREQERSTILVAGTRVPVGPDHLVQLADLAAGTLDEHFLAQDGKPLLASFAEPSTRGGGDRGGARRTVVARMPRMTEDQRSAIGLFGEIAARAWLQRRHPEVWWCSGYAAQLAGDTEASDSLGYDLEVPRARGPLMFEVKALTEALGEVVEFELGETEIRTAQVNARSDRYRILLVTSVLDAQNRRILQLPNPFSTRGQGRFRVVGRRGLRYQCSPGAGP
jgi:hypothetical protein